MQYRTILVATAISSLASVFAGAADAGVFSFSFGSGVHGTFTTGAVSSTDPSYDLITGLTFDLLSGTDLNGFPFSFANVVADDFQPGAAFNPTTDAFISHGGGVTVPDIGALGLPTLPPSSQIDPPSFSQGSIGISGTFGDEVYAIRAPLVITSASAPVPEPSTWAMMALGFVGLGAVAWRSRKVSVIAA